MDNYIVINGQRIELTDEQLEKLGIKVEKEILFTRRLNDCYYMILKDGTIDRELDNGGLYHKGVYDNVNYFNDKNFAQQVAWHELLNRKLLKYAYEHNAADCDWYDENAEKYCIAKVSIQNRFRVECTWVWKSNFVYFNSKDVAEAAIKDIIRPFMEEHPEFVW